MSKSKSTSSDSLPPHSAFKPTLIRLLQSKGEVSLVDALKHLAKKHKLSQKAISKRQPCGKETIFQNRVRWARWELKKEGTIETTRRGYFRLVKK